MSDDNHNQPQHPGHFVKENVIPKRLSVTKAAGILGIGRPALSNFLNAKANLSRNMATRLEKAFNVDKEKLLALQKAYDDFINDLQEEAIAVKSYTPSVLSISAMNIEAWADKVATRALLAAFIRRLVTTTCNGVTSSNFPAYDNSQVSGWDGYVESLSTTPWVPSEISGWEMGCNKGITAKANKDYQSRLSVGEEERHKTTFIFITPRNWRDKDKWIAEKKAEAKWKDVRAYDASDLEQWLETSIPTQVWLTEQLGLATEGCETPEQYWFKWSSSTEPSISPKLFISSIEQHSKTLKNWYKSDTGRILTITAASKDEAKSFLASALMQDESLSSLKEQVVFISSPRTLKRLAEVSTKVIPLIYTDECHEELAVGFNNRHAIVIIERNIKTHEPDIEVELPSYECFSQAISDMGMDDAKHDVLSNQTGRSPTLLRRLLAKTPALQKPVWAKSSNTIKSLIPLALAGSWNTTKESDKEILSCLSDKSSYSELEKEIAELTNMDDAPVWSEGSCRGVVSELESFHAVAGFVTEEDLNNFFVLAEYILSEDHPALDLERKDRWAANVYSKVREHSGLIRKSICQNLIILAVHGNALFGTRLGVDLAYRVSVLITKLLKDKNTRVWQAQQHDLPKYAEAAPEAFLSIIESELAKEKPTFEILFETESDMFSGCDRTGMLWALELLAWNETRLARVAKVLAKLAAYKVNDNWSNTPISSLADILLIWRPHTQANVEQRKEVLELICKDFPKIGWKLCVGLVDTRLGFTTGTYRPRWRGDASGAGNTLTFKEANAYGRKCMELMFAWPNHSLDTLKDLITCMTTIHEEEHEKIIEIIKNWTETLPPEIDKAELREHVRTQTLSRRAIIRDKKSGDKHSYPNGKELYDLLEPSDIRLKHHWLFAKSYVEFSPEDIDQVDLDYQLRDEVIQAQRLAALKEVYAAYGLNGILDVVAQSQAGYVIGYLFYSELRGTKDASELILACLKQSQENTYEHDACVQGILYQLDESELDETIVNIIKKLEDSGQNLRLTGKLFSLAPFKKFVWNMLSNYEIDIQNIYWKSVKPGRCDNDDLNFCITKLLSFNRPFTAFQLARFDFKHLESNILFKLLNEVATNTRSEDEHRLPEQHSIEDAFKVLDARNDFDRIELVRLEYLYIDVLRSFSSYGIPNLSLEIANSAPLYMEFIAYAFKRRDGMLDGEKWNIPQNKEQKEQLARKAYEVLEAINVIPGTKKDGSIDINHLSAWVEEVRNLAADNSRSIIADQIIGRLLSTSKIEKDGVWPTLEVRELLEDVQSEDISTGMEMGVYNSVGAEFVSTAKYNERANKYKLMSEKVMNKQPFVARMLMNISDKFIRDAERHIQDERLRNRTRDF